MDPIEKPNTETPTHEASSVKAFANWAESRGKLKAKYSQLTENDLQYTAGKESDLYDRVSARIGQSKDKVKEMIAAM